MGPADVSEEFDVQCGTTAQPSVGEGDSLLFAYVDMIHMDDVLLDPHRVNPFLVPFLLSCRSLSNVL